jgi:hypothetical protein
MTKPSAETSGCPALSSYTREDGVVMIEVAPGQFVNERVAKALPPPKAETEERVRP